MSGLMVFLLPGRKLGRKGRRRLFLAALLVVCSPVLLPLICLSFPFLLCVAGARLRSCPGPRGEEEEAALEVMDAASVDGEEAEGTALLNRYLEDQMGLVVAGEEDRALLRVAAARRIDPVACLS